MSGPVTVDASTVCIGDLNEHEEAAVSERGVAACLLCSMTLAREIFLQDTKSLPRYKSLAGFFCGYR